MVRPLGSNSTAEVDLRIVSATHRDLPRWVEEGAFRLDLLHRLAVLTVEVPPLRKRAADIEVLARWLVSRGEVAAAGISSEAMDALTRYAWPGNVRELRNVLCRAAMRSGGGRLHPSHLEFIGADPSGAARRPGMPSCAAEASVLLARSGGNVARAARAIGVARSTLRDHLRRLGVRGGPGSESDAASTAVHDG
jgi:DNA-binding NtrC family response regulator